MYCGKCGQQINEADVFCGKCGAPAPPKTKTSSQQQTSQHVNDVAQPQVASPFAQAQAQANKQAGIGLIVGGIVVFLVCSIIQGLGDSSMFSLSFYRTGNTFLDILISISMIPGWIATFALVVSGIRRLMNTKNIASTPAPSNYVAKNPAGQNSVEQNAMNTNDEFVFLKMRIPLLFIGVALLIFTLVYVAVSILGHANALYTFSDGVIGAALTFAEATAVARVRHAMIVLMLITFLFLGIFTLVQGASLKKRDLNRKWCVTGAIADFFMVISCLSLLVNSFLLLNAEAVFELANADMLFFSNILNISLLISVLLCAGAAVFYIISGVLQKKTLRRGGISLCIAGVFMMLYSLLRSGTIFLFDLASIGYLPFYGILFIANLLFLVSIALRSFAPLSIPKFISPRSEDE